MQSFNSPSDQEYQALIESIVNTLNKNGYPGNHVALPLERMYEVAHAKSLNFNKVLTALSDQGIAHKKEGNRLIFSPVVAQAQPNAAHSADANLFNNFDINSIPQDKMKDLMENAAKMMENMSSEEMDQVMSLYRNMSVQEREELAKKAASLGLMK